MTDILLAPLWKHKHESGLLFYEGRLNELFGVIIEQISGSMKKNRENAPDYILYIYQAPITINQQKQEVMKVCITMLHDVINYQGKPLMLGCIREGLDIFAVKNESNNKKDGDPDYLLYLRQESH